MQRLCVYCGANAGTGWGEDMSLFHRDALGHHVGIGDAQISAHGLLIDRVRGVDGQVNACQQREWPGAIVQGDRTFEGLGHGGNLARFGDAAHPGHIQHDDAHGVALHHLSERPARGDRLAGAGGNVGRRLELAQRVQVVAHLQSDLGSRFRRTATVQPRSRAPYGVSQDDRDLNQTRTTRVRGMGDAVSIRLRDGCLNRF